MSLITTRRLATDIIRKELAFREISIGKIILFGSRARGDAQLDSDWDFLVSINKELTFSKKAEIIANIQSKLAEKHISADVILKSKEKFNKESTNVGLISYYARKDGITV